MKPDYLSDPLDYRNYLSSPKDSQLWHDIRQAALSNEELQYALDRVKLIYYMSEQG